MYKKIKVPRHRTCYYCDTNLSSTWDHILPSSKGGSDNLYNLMACCRTCNSTLSNKVFKNAQEKRDFIRQRYKIDKTISSDIVRQTRKYLENSPKKPSKWLDRRPRRTLSEILYGYPYSDVTEP